MLTWVANKVGLPQRASYYLAKTIWTKPLIFHSYSRITSAFCSLRWPSTWNTFCSAGMGPLSTPSTHSIIGHMVSSFHSAISGFALTNIRSNFIIVLNRWRGYVSYPICRRWSLRSISFWDASYTTISIGHLSIMWLWRVLCHLLLTPWSEKYLSLFMHEVVYDLVVLTKHHEHS